MRTRNPKCTAAKGAERESRAGKLLWSQIGDLDSEESRRFGPLDENPDRWKSDLVFWFTARSRSGALIGCIGAIIDQEATEKRRAL